MKLKQGNRTIGSVADAFGQPGWYINGYAANIRVRSETVAAFSAGRAFQDILDIGCGDGSLSLSFLSKQTKITYVDLSAAMLEIVKSRISSDLRPQARFLNGDFAAMELANASFDLVLFVGVLAYVSDPDRVAAQLREVIRPGGLLICECTDEAHPFAKVNFMYRDLRSIVRQRPCQTFRHRAEEVIVAFERSGFKLRREFKYSYTLPILSKIVKGKESYSLIRRFYGTAESPRRQALGSERLIAFECA